MSDSEDRKILLATLVIGAIIGVICGWFLHGWLHPSKIIDGPGPEPADLRLRLGRLLNLKDSEITRLSLNLPPRAGCYPGTIFSLQRDLPFLQSVGSEDGNLVRGAEFSGEVRDKVKVDASSKLLTSMVSGDVGDSAEVEVEVVIKKAQVIDIKDSKILRDRVLKMPKINELKAKDIYPLVNYRAYDGIISFNISVKNGKKGELQSGLDKFKLQGSVAADGAGSLSLTTTERSVFAYLAMTTSSIQSDLAGQETEFVPVQALTGSAWDLAEGNFLLSKTEGAVQKINKN